MEQLKDIKKGTIVKYGNKLYIYKGRSGMGAELQECENEKLGLYTSRYTLVEVIKESE